MINDHNIQAFFALLRVGLWGNGNLDLLIDGTTDWQEVYRLATEQSVLGLVLAGLERSDVKPPRVLLLQWIRKVLMIEQRNKKMNAFVTNLIEKLRRNDIYAILVKGQGIAQCYEKTLWRSFGDVDLFLSDENYQKAKELLLPLGKITEPEEVAKKHFAMDIEGWAVELHGTLKSGLSSRVDKVLVRLQEDTFYDGQVRLWTNGQTQIFLLKAENDAFYVFTHILQHFYKEGVGLRQICDWCRLMWTYRDSLNYGLLKKRIRRAGLMSEWKAFYNLASRYLGMPDLGSQDSQARMSDQRSSVRLTGVESATSRHSSNKFGSAHDSIADFMVCDSRYDKKADRIMEFILKSGNMGHNRDMSHFSKYPYLIRKCVSMGRRIGDLINHARIFPLDSLRFFPRIMFNGIISAVKGE
ncbi:nucleotidyltransferase family protein [Prevotella sp. E9-3]|uniref:nucleotidyltransferase domain-containing protein n=1 Tax=Prevotella sp. E9-3 TaxID=2913621 RepID=UPI001EDC769E|nr:nucleotidyltransferase family protein [Prevotella sp. E9-3]UKK47477.1 nucleotidyltransferase family protein [Prevotella sp. E9-3]